MNEHAKSVLDVGAVATMAATLITWLPPLAAALSIVWTGIRIYETATVQRWLKKRRGRA